LPPQTVRPLAIDPKGRLRRGTLRYRRPLVQRLTAHGDCGPRAECRPTSSSTPPLWHWPWPDGPVWLVETA